MKKSFVRRHLFPFCNLVIVFFIVSGFTIVVYNDTRTYQDLTEQNIKCIVNLADLNIEKFIESTMSKPVTVSRTMANDSFLKTWISKETKYKDDNNYLKQLYNYLEAYRQKYGYSTVFCVSAQTGHYYYQNGLLKTISPENLNDIWFYNFIKSGQEHDLEINTCKENGNENTIFVNFRIENVDGTLLGVIGVGIPVIYLENQLRFYEQEYGLSICIINSSPVQTSFPGSTAHFITENDLENHTGISPAVLLNKAEDAQLQWFTINGTLKCLITRYNSTLGWHLIVEKDTASLRKVFREQIRKNIIFMLISLAACISVTTIVFIKYNQMVILNENRDELTGLFNRKLFLKQFPSFMRKHREKSKTLFMLDIDKFKLINDTYGHLFGNAVLEMIGEKLHRLINGQGMTARWGGDEFTGILALDLKASEDLLTELMNELKNEKKDARYRITVSVGLVTINQKNTIEEIFKQADTALYCSKENGRNRVTVCDVD
jgi:diguanylate cyclase (GGDEF)-like protein